MKRFTHSWQDIGVTAQCSSFIAGEVTEHHAMLHVEPRQELFGGQLSRIYEAEERLAKAYPNAKVVLKRYFLSDSTNQAPLMRDDSTCAISYIQQPPLDGSKIAVWVYMSEGMNVLNVHDTIVQEHNGYKHLWKMGMCENIGDSACQTQKLLVDYEEMLKKFDATLAENCIRTWFFVRDVDTQYAGMVKARRENFAEQGLTPTTHYVSSTGIQGLPADTKALIQLGTYALTGFSSEQERYLYAPTHLNPTYEYGVTFERGTVMEYGDRAHCFISGTASINNKGEVVYVGDVLKQTERMLENVEALLREGNTCFDDVAHIVVYLRDVADYEVVRTKFEERFPEMPIVYTLAPVCRPTWLIEMECVAIAKRNNPQFRNF